MSLYDDIKNKVDYNPNNSVQWFKNNVTTPLQNMSTQKFLGENQPWQTSGKNINVGSMIAYGYFPKHHDTLPHYDKFPLALPFSVDAKGFTAINLHYLPFMYRINLLDKLIHFRTDDKFDENTKLKMSWGLLTSLSKHNEAQHAVKRYLWGHVKTNFINIPMIDWPISVFLPIARFVGATEQQVWRGRLR